MSDTTYIGRKMRSLKSAPQFDGFSRVVITVSEDLEYTAGNKTGRTLHLTCPWGTKQMAKDILADIRGFQYQPYTAEGAFLDPAAELGDTVTAGNIHSGIYTQKLKFGPLLTADVGAPEDEELDHEYPYTPKQDRAIKRSIRNLTTELRVQDGRITAEVSARENAVTDLRATLDIQADRISAEVTAREKDVKDLKASLNIQAGQISAEVTARESDVKDLRASLNIQADRISAEVTAREKDVKDLKASLDIQAEKISAEVTAREKDVKNLRATLDIQADNISAKVSKTGGSASSFGWELSNSSWIIKANGSNVLKATKSGLEVYGKITATSGKIGGFTINSNYLSYNSQKWGGTNTTGIYIGTKGIQLGKKFKVDNAGNLTAASGKFLGTVSAGKILYGTDSDGVGHGTLSGYALDENSISGNRLEYNTVSTDYTSSGINSSLGSADYAYGAVVGWNNLNVGESMFYLGGSLVYKTTKIIDGTAIKMLAWSGD